MAVTIASSSASVSTPAAPPRKRRRRRFSASRIAGNGPRIVYMLGFAVFFIVPLIWLVLAPTKSQEQIATMSPFAFGSLENVAIAWNNLMSFNRGVLLQWLANSIEYAAWTTAIAVVTSIAAGYGLAKFEFFGRKALLWCTLIAMIIPEIALVLPLFLEMNALQLVGSKWAVILPLGLFPFGVYLSYLHFHANFPATLMEAARIDGAGEARIFFSLALPLSRSLFGLVGFFAFIRAWSAFFLPFVMLADDRTFTLQIGLKNLLESTGAINPSLGQSTLPIHAPEAALAGLITVAPILLVFLFAQRFLTSGQLAGAEKG